MRWSSRSSSVIWQHVVLRSREWLHLLLAQPWCLWVQSSPVDKTNTVQLIVKRSSNSTAIEKSVMLSFVMVGLPDEWTSLSFFVVFMKSFFFSYIWMGLEVFLFVYSVPYTWTHEILAGLHVCYFWTLSQSILYLKNIHIIFCFKAIRSYFSVNQNKNVRNARILFSWLKLPIPFQDSNITFSVLPAFYFTT